MQLTATSFIFTFLIIVTSSCAQDLKWSFEEWELVDDLVTPKGWDVYHQVEGLDTMVNRFYKDSIHVVYGNYSLRAEKDPIITSAFLNCTSMASLYQVLDAPLGSNKSMYFSVKTESLNEWMESLVSVTVGFSEGGDYLGRVEWVSYEEIKEFVEVELPIVYDVADAISIRIDAASQNGALDGCNLESIVWLDDMRIQPSTMVDIDYMEIEYIMASPNPTNGTIALSSSEFDGNTYQVTDIMGRVTQSGVVVDRQIELDHTGFNFIEIDRKENIPLRLKIIKVD